MPSILVIEDKDSMQKMLTATLESEGYEVDAVGDGPDALDKARDKRYDLVLTDLKLPNMDGLEVLSQVKEIDPETSVILMTAYGTIESAVKAMRLGAYDFLTKPFDTDHLSVLIKRALENRRLMAENSLLREEIANSHGAKEIVGVSDKIKEAIDSGEYKINLKTLSQKIAEELK